MKKVIKQLVKLSIVSIICYFIFSQISHNWDVLARHIVNFSWIEFVISMFCFLLGQLCFSLGWFKIISSSGQKTSFRLSNYYWTLSSLGKYVPGRVWQFAGRLYLFSKLRFNKTEIISYSIVEQFYFLQSALILFSLFSMLKYEIIFESYYRMAIIISIMLILLGFLFLHPRILNSGIRFVSKYIHKVEFSFDMTFKESLFFFLHYFIGWLLTGIGFALLTNSFIKFEFETSIFLIGANAGAYFLGYIVIITPGGLGIREGVLTYLMNLTFIKGIGAMISVITRIWYIAGEILYLGLSYVVAINLKIYVNSIQKKGCKVPQKLN